MPGMDWLFYSFLSGSSTPEMEVDCVHRSGWASVAAQLAAPVAMGLLIGGVLAYQAGSTNNAVQPRPLGAVATPTPSFGKATGPAPAPSAHWLTPPASLTPSTAPASLAPTATPRPTMSNAVQQSATASASGT
jgi:hypothetical protein